jgi:hypothetical protein
MGGDGIGRAVGTPVEQKRVPDAADDRGRDDALILHLDRLGAGTPHRIENPVDVLLVHDQVVWRGVAREPSVGVALRVVEDHHQTRAMDRIHVGLSGQLRRPPLHRLQCGVRRAAVEGVDLLGQGFPLGVQVAHRRARLAHQVDQAGSVAATDLGTA